MKKLIIVATVSLSLLALVAHTALAEPVQSLPISLEELGLDTSGGQVGPGNTASICFAGFYVDDAGSVTGVWDSTLYVANFFDVPMLFDVQIWITGAVQETSHQAVPRGLIQLSCEQLRSCDSQGWILIESNAPLVSAILFVTNNVFGGGAFTTIQLECIPPQ
jgi:hypothetical protein